MERLTQRKRNRNLRQRQSIIAIGCEGKNKTETIYFRNYLSRECIIKFSTGTHTNPVGMANDLIEFIKREDIKAEYGDKIYLLVDTDINQNKDKQINEAKNICSKYDIQLITSTPTFEFWYILHYIDTTKIYQSSKQVKDELKFKIPNYSENLNIYNVIKDRTDIAIENARKIEKYHLNNNKVVDSENANPHTSVYKVVEELKNRKNSGI